MLIGAAYLLWLPYHHFTGHEDADGSPDAASRRRRGSGMSPFWATVVKVELTDIVFAIDSILVAVALSDKTWVIITGGMLGVIAMRLVIGQLLVLVNRYPTLVDGAFVIIAWVGIKLMLEYLHGVGLRSHFEVPKWLSLGLIVVIFAIAFIDGEDARDRSRPMPLDEKAEEILLRGRTKIYERRDALPRTGALNGPAASTAWPSASASSRASRCRACRRPSPADRSSAAPARRCSRRCWRSTGRRSRR